MLRQFLRVIQIVTLTSIDSNSIKIPNNSSRLLQVILQVRRQLELQNEFIIVLILNYTRN